VITREYHCSVNAGPRNIAARRLIAMATLLPAVGSLSGCYAFIPTTSPSLAEATPVTVSLTLGGTVALQETLGQGVNEIEGTVLRSTNDSLVIAVENTYTTSRQKFSSSGTTAAVPRPYINQVKVRTFSKRRTVYMILGGVIVAAVAGASVAAGGGNSPPVDPGPIPP
jgi:hypothetical protein